MAGGRERRGGQMEGGPGDRVWAEGEEEPLDIMKPLVLPESFFI